MARIYQPPFTDCKNDGNSGYPNICQHLANRLSELIIDVAYIDIDKDDKRELLTLMLRTRDNTTLPARALSDGTLRFLGLAILELDARSGKCYLFGRTGKWYSSRKDIFNSSSFTRYCD